ncbi:S1 RNA-binding domain-containing protein [Streptomyces sp. NBC_00091]|uniref:S1 RNA-binding domain-containing protein n=1 Tax=Streptomyces sp. NBC_00091 TaxID=2975648 RepID=UPI0022520DA5|nr:S1 RNA-binding domain-containing protein [Streptomyces sp. NBC_00091]MCX5376755.1 S1 RNA-binding domain-containing protein [Streptomyces sp. NBC_00091]
MSYVGTGEKFQPGQVCRGVISGMDGFNLIVELDGGVRGTVTAANLSWRKVEHPSEIAEIGQEVTVVFMSFDPDRGNISLSLKDLEPDPFVEFARTQLGQKIFGRITKFTPIGTFLRLPSGIDALLPDSNPQNEWIKNAEIGERVEVRVEYINLQQRQVHVVIENATKQPQ